MRMLRYGQTSEVNGTEFLTGFPHETTVPGTALYDGVLRIKSVPTHPGGCFISRNGSPPGRCGRLGKYD